MLDQSQVTHLYEHNDRINHEVSKYCHSEGVNEAYLKACANEAKRHADPMRDANHSKAFHKIAVAIGMILHG